MMPPVRHGPPALPAHGPDLSAIKSRSAFSRPISWYTRTISAVSRLAVWRWPLPKTSDAHPDRDFYQAWIWLGWASYLAANWATSHSP